MKFVKRILLILLALILVGGIGTFFYFKNKFMNAPPSTITVSNLGQPFEFVWSREKLNDKIEPHNAIFVPVTIAGVDRTLYMQFDTGAPSTVFSYKNVLSINEKYGDIFHIDTVDNQVRVIDTSFKVGTVDIKASSIDFRGTGNKIDWSDSTSVIKIGTVGSDFMENHTLIMDYKKEQITLAESVPETIEKEAEFLPFTFDGRKVFLSAKLNDTPANLWFDSGSSAFELIVDEDTFLELAKPGAERESFLVNSWGSQIPGHNIESNGLFEFGSTTAPLTYVTNFEWPNKLMVWTMKASSIGGDLGGMTGNKLFLNKTLVLDTPNLRYAVLP